MSQKLHVGAVELIDFYSMEGEIAERGIDGLEPLILGQKRILEEISAFQEAKSTLFQEDEDKATQDDFCQKGFRHLQEAQVHTDIVFVGFPSSVVEHIGEKWLKALSSDSAVANQGYYGGKIFDLPGDMTIRHHFHLVEVSFHVADVVRDKLGSLLRDALKEDLADIEEGIPINAWEIDEMLTSLTDSLTTSGPDFVAQGNMHHYTPANTVYIINVDLDATWDALRMKDEKGRKYWYRNGFTEAQLSALAKYSTVTERSRAVLHEAKKAFTSRVNMPYEDTHDQATLVEGDAEHHVEKMLGYSGWPTPHNWDDYGYGTDDHYRKVTSHIHNRKAITESRAWAQDWAANIGMTLEARALQLLSSTAEASSHSRHLLAESVVRHTKEAVDGGGKLERDPACGAGVWGGRGRVSWVDEGSSGRVPQLQRKPPPPRGSRPLVYEDWQDILKGDEASQLAATEVSAVEMQRRIRKLGSSVLSHYSTVLNLARQVGECPYDVHMSLLAPKDLLEVKTVESPDTRALYTKIERLHSTGEMSVSCAALMQQAAFLSSVMVASNHLRTDSMYLLDKDKDDNGDLDGTNNDELLRTEEALMWVQRLQEVHLESLSNVLSTSALVDSEVHVGVSLPSKVADFFGRVMAKVMYISRSITAPPLTVHVNTHSPYLPLPRDTTLINSDSHAVAKSKASERELLASGIARAGLSTFVASHIEEGEIMSMKQLSPQGQSLWAHTLPPTPFPQNIDVVVYVVSMQSSYPSLAGEAGETRAGLDFQQIVRGLRQLKLRNQEMSVSLQRVNGLAADGVDDSRNSIRAGMDMCLRSTSDLENYLDAACFWTSIRSKDTNAVGADKDKQRPWIAANQHVPVFVLSLDEPHPLFVSRDKQTAIVSGDGVLVVQNRQRNIFTGTYCGGRRVVMDGRSPTGAALVATAQVIAGISMNGPLCSHSAPSLYGALLDQNGDSGGVISQQAFGSSVTFSNTAEAEMAGSAFSEVTVLGAHRARIIHIAGFSAALLRESVAATPEGTRERRRAVAVRAFFTAVTGKALHDLDTVDSDSLHVVAAEVNAVFHLTKAWVASQVLPQRVLHIIAQKLGDVDFLDREPYENFYPQDEADSSEGILSIIGYRNVIIFLLVAITTFAWPSKKKSRLL